MNPAVAICGVFIGCASNVLFLELLVKEFPGSGNIITFFQFLFIAVEGFIRSAQCGRQKPVIPISTYVTMVTLFFLVSVVNNYAFNFNIPVPLHIIFRSGSLMANLILGMIILHKRYTLPKYVAVVMITVGIVMATIASAKDVNNAHTAGENDADSNSMYNEFVRLLIGIAMLTFALFMSARMGIYQETVYKKFGKHPDEALFYNHALPLPIFLFFAPDIYNHIVMFSQSAPFALPFGLNVPEMWVYLAGNVLTQYLCIKSVFILTTECASLTVTLVVTLRKFFSLVVSILYFSNPFTLTHWIGTILVFFGTLLFSEVLPFTKTAKKVD